MLWFVGGKHKQDLFNKSKSILDWIFVQNLLNMSINCMSFYWIIMCNSSHLLSSRQRFQAIPPKPPSNLLSNIHVSYTSEAWKKNAHNLTSTFSKYLFWTCLTSHSIQHSHTNKWNLIYNNKMQFFIMTCHII